MAAPKKSLRILYAVGPGDVVGLQRDLIAGKLPAFQVGLTFSKPFLDWCDESGAEAQMISCHARADHLQVGRHTVENRPRNPLYFGSGIKHHIGVALYGLMLVKETLRRRADILIVDSGTTHWIVLSLLALFRIPVIAVIHSALWPMGFPPQRKIDRILRWSDGLYFRHFAAATVCVSPECERQVRAIAGKPKGEIYQCRAQYLHEFFDRVKPVPPHAERPFRILFLGRVEENKGVFMIAAMAERLEREMPGQFAWKIVGAGSASEALKQQVIEKNLGHVIEIPGLLPDEATALATFSWAHIMIAPTTSTFPEGLAMVAAESVLAGRPVLLSTVVPAWEVLGDAAIKAEADNVESFVEAIRKLATDAAYYERCRRATSAVQAQFYDRSQGLGAVLGRIVSSLKESAPLKLR